jgi:predicted nucleotidyltransferase
LLLLFGSRVSGKTHPFSDYDFGFLAEREISPAEQSQMYLELAQLARTKEENVDIANLNNINPFMKYRILKNNKVLFEYPQIYENYFVRSLQDYFESKKLLRLRDTIIQNQINNLKKIYA